MAGGPSYLHIIPKKEDRSAVCGTLSLFLILPTSVKVQVPKSMRVHSTNIPNELVTYRERLGLTQEQVASALGLRRSKLLTRLEQDHRIPRFLTAIKLSAIYRVPIEFLFPQLYEKLRSEIRHREEAIVAREKAKETHGTV